MRSICRRGLCCDLVRARSRAVRQKLKYELRLSQPGLNKLTKYQMLLLIKSEDMRADRNTI